MLRPLLLALFCALFLYNGPAFSDVFIPQHPGDEEDCHPRFSSSEPAKDREERFAKTKHSAESGNAHAEFELSHMYTCGWGVRWNNAEALKWLHKAAKHGNPFAEYKLAVMYYGGRAHGGIVEQDYAEAVKWYRKSAEQGYADARAAVGAMYERGHGVTKNYMEAYFWFSASGIAAFRDEPAFKHLTSEQKAIVDKRVAAWLKDHPALPRQPWYN